MTHKSNIENKISAIKKYLGILDRYRHFSQKEIEESIDLRGATERYLYLAVQASIDLAEALVAYKKLRKPSTMAENFIILQEEKFLSSDLAEKMTKMTGFRNVIAHDYADLNYDIVYAVLQSSLVDIEAFLSSIKEANIIQD